MIDVPLQAIANQQLTIPLNGSLFDITIKEASGAMVMSVTKDNVLLIANTRMVGNYFVLPYDYLNFEDGNFYIATQGDEIPYYTAFGITQFLVYVTNDEIASA